ncbi:hypothetical protein [Polaromonas sp. CG_9.11]|uniref:hypothetical protein n=1 Tax=Polaromonas sp. CG_9.11 TaxID=2787730 RepID=UPI0018CA817C|nr:hypothetical protein [Polaromonas sp. CG_9.11]MBG6077772.1 hypothetical protein [Polaromonas sp. CG_9.11]
MSSTLGPAAALLRQQEPVPAAAPKPAQEPVQGPGSGDSSALRHGIREVPRLVAGKTSPKFSLVLLLSRAPAAGEDSIRPLLMSAYLGMELDYRLPSSPAQPAQTRPVFARQARVWLQAPGQPAFAMASLNAPLLRGALHTPLTREQTLAVLDALDDVPGPLALAACIDYRAEAVASGMAPDLCPAELWDRLKAVAVDGALGENAFQQVFGQFNLAPEAFADFRRACDGLLVPSQTGALLGRRPAPGARRSKSATGPDALYHIEVACPLQAVLGHALTAADRAACLSVVGPSGNLQGGPLLDTLRCSSSRAARGAVGMGAMLAGNRIQTVAATLQPSVRPMATAHLISSEAIRIQQPVTTVSTPAVSQLTHYMLPQAVFLTTAFVAESLPILGDLNAPLFSDKNNPGLRWYLPDITLVRPAANEAPDGSPFLFDLERIGTSASGRPAIRARLRFTLEMSPSAATRTALAASPGMTSRMIEPVEPSVTLSVPYIDDVSGQLRRSDCRASIVRSGNQLAATVELINDAARTAYGSLSTTGFQSEPARLEVAFQFSGYAPVMNRPPLVLGGKISSAVLLATQRDDADSIRVASGGREFVVRPGSLQTMKPNLTLAGRISSSTAAIALPDKIRYAQRTTIRQQSIDTFFSCAELGAFYREKQAAATVSMGCAEAFRLGQASSLTYLEVVALNRPNYRVFRNLRQPGRFLLVPLRFEVTRYAPGTPEREYRPALIVYAALDADQPEKNRIRFEAMLGPSLSPCELEDLRRRLLLEAASPVLELPNMLAQRTEFSWNLTATPPIDAVTSATPEGLHTALSTDLASALLLKTLIQNTGLGGTARFVLDDGSVVTSALSVHLGRITGPWLSGPITLQPRGDTLQLTNRIESSVAVKDVYLFNGPGEPARLPVEATLAPGASIDIAAPAGYSAAQADFVTLADGNPTLEEVRAMIEEIECNVVFIDVVNHENHGLTRLDIDARLQGVPGVYRVGMDNRRGAVNFLLPLTTYLAARIVEFRLTKVFAAQPAEVLAWRAWDMQTGSNIVTVTSEMIST